MSTEELLLYTIENLCRAARNKEMTMKDFINNIKNVIDMFI